MSQWHLSRSPGDTMENPSDIAGRHLVKVANGRTMGVAVAVFADHLRHALENNPSGIHSVRALAKELAMRHKRKEENERRTLNRYLAGVTIPRPDKVAEIRELLQLTEVELPSPPAARQSTNERLSQLEGEVESLRQRVEDLLAHLGTREASPRSGQA